MCAEPAPATQLYSGLHGVESKLSSTHDNCNGTWMEPLSKGQIWPWRDHKTRRAHWHRALPSARSQRPRSDAVVHRLQRRSAIRKKVVEDDKLVMLRHEMCEAKVLPQEGQELRRRSVVGELRRARLLPLHHLLEESAPDALPLPPLLHVKVEHARHVRQLVHHPARIPMEQLLLANFEQPRETPLACIIMQQGHVHAVLAVRQLCAGRHW
eukprot:CAMPEP_0119358114 /NCGR_PEP_ID=MMETSP1334-20130426/6394_1 /TAXON_ID=127549 /ORGANISM="Calcidiscus leptoporus, Strain RCC1130" /LENGTH=210 /DNA_ID=CAMNT_0007372535 /DNA_START=51 /DNA_END=683 /DNA_ORIENTATION=-